MLAIPLLVIAISLGAVDGRIGAGSPRLFANGDPSISSSGSLSSTGSREASVEEVSQQRSVGLHVPNALMRLRGGSKARRIVVLGPPGSGKGTLCAELVRELGAVHLSSGDILRDAIKRGSPLIDEETRKTVESGGLVRDEVVTSLVMSRLLQDEECSRRGWILDGYPRTPSQAKKLIEQSGTEPDVVILLDVNKQVILDRILGRLIDPTTGAIYHSSSPPTDPEVVARLVRRTDDQKQFFERRYDEFASNIDGIRSIFGSRLHVIKGGATINMTLRDALNVISNAQQKEP